MKEDTIKNEGARVVTTLFIDFFRRSWADNSELIRAFMINLVTCKNEEDPSKNESTRVVTTLIP